MRSALCMWICLAMPAVAAVNPDLGRQAVVDSPTEDVERVALPCLDEGHDQRLVTWFIVDKAGRLRGEGQQVVRYRC